MHSESRDSVGLRDRRCQAMAGAPGDLKGHSDSDSRATTVRSVLVNIFQQLCAFAVACQRSVEMPWTSVVVPSGQCLGC